MLRKTLIIAVFMASLASAYTANDWFPALYSNKVELGYTESEFLYRAVVPVATTLNLGSFNIMFKNNTRNLSNWQLWIVNDTWQWENHSVLESYCNDFHYPNGTLFPGANCTSTIIGYRLDNVSVSKLESPWKQWSVNETHRMRLRINYIPETGLKGFDWIPAIKGNNVWYNQSNWAWSYTGWASKTWIVVNHSEAHTWEPFNLNITNLVGRNANGSDIRVLLWNGNGTEIDYGFYNTSATYQMANGSGGCTATACYLRFIANYSFANGTNESVAVIYYGNSAAPNPSHLFQLFYDTFDDNRSGWIFGTVSSNSNITGGTMNIGVSGAGCQVYGKLHLQWSGAMNYSGRVKLAKTPTGLGSPEIVVRTDGITGDINSPPAGMWDATPNRTVTAKSEIYVRHGGSNTGLYANTPVYWGVNNYSSFTASENNYTIYINKSASANQQISTGQDTANTLNSANSSLDTVIILYGDCGNGYMFSVDNYVIVDYGGNSVYPIPWVYDKPSTTYLGSSETQSTNDVLARTNPTGAGDTTSVTFIEGYCNRSSSTGHSIIYNYTWWKNNVVESSGIYNQFSSSVVVTADTNAGWASSGAGQAFTVPNNANTSDNLYATSGSISSSDAYTQYLNGTGFGFNIPTAATIKGIMLMVERKASSILSGRVTRDWAVTLMKDGIGVGQNLKTATDYTDSDVSVIYGNSTWMWQTSWTPAEINNPMFGANFSAYASADTKTRTVTVDHINITVYYTTVDNSSASQTEVLVQNKTTGIAAGTWILQCGTSDSSITNFTNSSSLTLTSAACGTTTPPAAPNTDFVIDLAQNPVITTSFNLGTGKLMWCGVGNAYFIGSTVRASGMTRKPGDTGKWGYIFGTASLFCMNTTVLC